jgi:hypothetical protein
MGLSLYYVFSDFVYSHNVLAGVFAVLRRGGRTGSTCASVLHHAVLKRKKKEA